MSLKINARSLTIQKIYSNQFKNQPNYVTW